MTNWSYATREPLLAESDRALVLQAIRPIRGPPAAGQGSGTTIARMMKKLAWHRWPSAITLAHPEYVALYA